MYHADIGRGASPNSSAREAMSTSDADLGSEITTARPAVACTFIESGAISAQATKQSLPSSGVKPLHAAQMAKIVTVPQEFRHSALHAAAGAGAREAARSANRRLSSGGTTMKPRRSAGLIVLLKLPMCSTRPP